MEYLIDTEDVKKVQVQMIDNEPVLILMQDDIEIFISSEMYNTLKNFTDELSQALVRICLCKDDVDCNVALGNDVYAYAKSPFRCVQIRQYFEKDGEMLPTKQGISLKRKQWSALLDIFNSIDKDFSTPQPPRCRELHQNQEDYFTCPVCCPGNPSTPKKKSRSANPLKKRLFDD